MFAVDRLAARVVVARLARQSGTQTPQFVHRPSRVSDLDFDRLVAVRFRLADDDEQIPSQFIW
jgi:hypothetical protein